VQYDQIGVPEILVNAIGFFQILQVLSVFLADAPRISSNPVFVKSAPRSVSMMLHSVVFHVSCVT
jgi:hypothetical protein